MSDLGTHTFEGPIPTHELRGIQTRPEFRSRWSRRQHDLFLRYNRAYDERYRQLSRVRQPLNQSFWDFLSYIVWTPVVQCSLIHEYPSIPAEPEQRPGTLAEWIGGTRLSFW